MRRRVRVKTSFLDDIAFTTAVAKKTAEQMKSAVMETFACKGKYEKLKADYELMNLHKTSEMVNVKDKSSLCGKVRCAFGEAGGEFVCCYVFSMLFR